MYYTGQNLILRLEANGAFFSEGAFLPAERIKINLATLRNYVPKDVPSWVLVRVNAFGAGRLDCSILTFNPKGRSPFNRNQLDVSGVRRLLLGGSNTPKLLRLTDTGPRFGSNKTSVSKSRYSASSQRVVPAPRHVLPPPAREQPSPREYPVCDYQQEYTFRIDEMKIVDGAALFDANFVMPRFRMVRLELRVENDFLESDFEYIKPYIAKRLRRLTLTVSATIQTKGAEVVGVLATSELVDQITPELIERVRLWQIRRALNKAGGDEELVTVDDIFQEEALEKSNIKPTDEQFVKDILAIKKPKHAEQTRYLSARHVHTVMRLRWVKQQGAFLFLLPGKKDSFLILEKLNSAEATYLWRLHAKGAQLGDDRGLLKQKFEWVEQEISIISTEGRKVYKANAPEDFVRIRHDYESKDGFAVWKDRLHQILDAEDGA